MATTAETVGQLFGLVHSNLREAIQGMDDDALNWSPGPEMNSAAVLVTHTLASERDTYYLVRGLTADRDRDAEFAVEGATRDELLAALDQADAVLAEHIAAITEDDLAATRERPGRDPQTGLHWLLNNYGHAREHLGHLHMAAQLWKAKG
jgi:hypothetical protein